MNEKKNGAETGNGLLPNCVTIQLKLYRDIAFWACSLDGKHVMIQSDCIVTSGGRLGWRSVSRYNQLYRDRLRT